MHKINKAATIISVLTFIVVIAACNNKGSGQQLDPKTFSEKLHAENNAVLLDVRTPDEYAGGHINGSVNINYNSEEFKAKIQKLDKSEPVYVYCLSGGRSSDAADDMREAGFKNVYELKGGILKWKAAGLEVSALARSSSKNLISMDQFNALVNDTIPVLVDFYAPWCAPCRKMMPVLNDMETEYKGKLKIVRINIDDNMQLAGQLMVTDIPVFMVYKNNKLEVRKDSVITKEELLKLLF